MQLTQNHINTILQYLKVGQTEKALQLTNKLLKDNSDNLQLNKLTAYIYSMKSNHHLSIELLNRIKNKYPQDFDISNNLGHSYLHIEKTDMALENINNAIKIEPDNPAPYKNLASVYLLLRDFDKASLAIEKCLENIKKISNNLNEHLTVVTLKSQILLAQNKKDLAINLLKNYLDKTFDPELLFNLIAIDKKIITNELVSRCKDLINNNVYETQLDKFNKLSPLLFFLAQYYENIDQTKSEEYYNQANSEIIKIQRLQIIVFQKRFRKIMDSYTEIKDLEISDQNRGDKNIFIVGMPRSGTSLLESVITANDSVFPSGELETMNQQYNIFEKSNKANSVEGLNFISDEYLDTTNSIKGNYEKIVDKMPLNFSLIGFVLKSLPLSKIILILRDPWDIAISLYKQRYVKNVPYAASFFNIGVYMANFEAMVNFWLSFDEIKGKIYILKYENLVSNFDTEQKAIYQFCQIDEPFNEEARKNHFVRTASMNQVQNKIHKHSVKKKSFELGKKEFFDAYQSQKEFWKDRSKIKFNNSFFGYLD